MQQSKLVKDFFHVFVVWIYGSCTHICLDKSALGEYYCHMVAFTFQDLLLVPNCVCGLTRELQIIFQHCLGVKSNP